QHFVRFIIWCLTDRHRSSTFVFAFIVKRFRVFRAPLQPFIDFRFRIYRETLSRFSCAASSYVGVFARFAGHSGSRSGPHRLGAQFG
ncbi:hypothetical protein ABLN86_03375, partial [Mycobacterium tuberculosis]